MVPEVASDVASTPPGTPEIRVLPPVTVKPIVSFFYEQSMKEFDEFINRGGKGERNVGKGN